MGSKKLYKILQHWFPELIDRDFPPAEQRDQYDVFLDWLWLNNTHPERSYVMYLDPLHYYENGLSHSAVLQDHQVDVALVQRMIRERITPLLRHYELNKQLIGTHCDFRSQVYAIVLQEICKLLKSLDYELLLLCSGDYHWLAVPNQQEQIDQFCRLFEKQFKHVHKNIEHYQPENWLWST